MAKCVVGLQACSSSQQAPPLLPPSQRAVPPPRQHGRRSLLALSAAAVAMAVARPLPAHAAAENAGGVDSASSPLIQELLKRTEEKREERKKERLEDYYRRNYEDYFRNSPPSGDSENQRAIRAWLEKGEGAAPPPKGEAEVRAQEQQ